MSGNATTTTQLEAIIRIATAPPGRLSYRDRMLSIEGLAKATLRMIEAQRAQAEAARVELVIALHGPAASTREPDLGAAHRAVCAILACVPDPAPRGDADA